MTPKNEARNGKNANNVAVEAQEIKAVLMEQPDFLQPVVQEAVQAILEMEMEECLQAGKHERTGDRQGYRSGYYRRRLITRVGTLVSRAPQDRSGRFSTEVFEQYQRSEKALVAALAQMYVQGVSTRKVAAVTQELCGHEFSASSIWKSGKPNTQSSAPGWRPTSRRPGAFTNCPCRKSPGFLGRGFVSLAS